MSVSSVNTLYPFASYAPAGASEPAAQVARSPEPAESKPALQAQAISTPSERSEEPKKASSGPGQVLDRKV